MYRAGHRAVAEILCFASENIAFQLTTYNYFMNPVRPRRDGVKEDYYV